MRLITFAFVLAVLFALPSFAQGLKITEIEVHVDYDDAYAYRLERHSNRFSYANVPISNGSKINADVFPGSNLTFTIRVENMFSDQSRILKDVFAKVTIEDIDDGADLSYDSMNFDLEPGNDERLDVKFNIPLDIEKGAYNVVIEAQGDDRNGTSSFTKVKLRLGIKKLSHDLRITKVELNSGIVTCEANSRLTAQIANLGSISEEDIALEFKSSELNLALIDKGISLKTFEDTSDEKMRYTKSLNIAIAPSLKAGIYRIFINLYWKNSILFDQKIAELSVRDCGSLRAVSDSKPKNDSKNNTDVIILQNSQPIETQKGYRIVSKELGVFDYLFLLSMVLGVFFVALVAISVLMWHLRNE